MKLFDYFCNRVSYEAHILIAHSLTELPPRKRKTSVKTNNREVAPYGTDFLVDYWRLW